MSILRTLLMLEVLPDDHPIIRERMRREKMKKDENGLPMEEVNLFTDVFDEKDIYSEFEEMAKNMTDRQLEHTRRQLRRQGSMFNPNEDGPGIKFILKYPRFSLYFLAIVFCLSILAMSFYINY